MPPAVVALPAAEMQTVSETPSAAESQRENRIVQEPAEVCNMEEGAVIEDKQTGFYSILSAENRTVEYLTYSSGSSTAISVPDSITVNGVTYSVVSVAEGAFEGNRNLKKVAIGRNVRVIGEKAFANCKNLKNVIIGESVSCIGASAFQGCAKLTSIVLPASVKEVGSKAFGGCRKLRLLTIRGTGMTSKTLSGSAFKDLSRKTVIRVPKTMKKTYKKLFVKKGLSKKAKIR